MLAGQPSRGARPLLPLPWASPARRKTEAAASIVERLEQDGVDELKSVTKSRATRTEDETTQKILNDHFKGWTVTQTDMAFRDGQSLRQRISADRRKWASDPTFTMGKYYYMQLRELYGDEAPENLLSIDDKNEPEDDSVAACLKTLFAHNRDCRSSRSRVQR